MADGPVRIWVQRFLTFQFVCLGWVFFNASGLSERLRRVGSRASRAGGSPRRWSLPSLCSLSSGRWSPSWCPAARVERLQAVFSRQRSVVQVGVLAVALLGITTFGPVGVAPFIYYRF